MRYNTGNEDIDELMLDDPDPDEMFGFTPDLDELFEPPDVAEVTHDLLCVTCHTTFVVGSAYDFSHENADMCPRCRKMLMDLRERAARTIQRAA